MKIEKILDILLYVVLFGLLVLCLNLFYVNIHNEDNKLAECASKNSHLIDSSSGYYCFKGIKNGNI